MQTGKYIYLHRLPLLECEKQENVKTMSSATKLNFLFTVHGTYRNHQNRLLHLVQHNFHLIMRLQLVCRGKYNIVLDLTRNTIFDGTIQYNVHLM